MVQRVRVTFEVDLPIPGATLDNAIEWVEYHIGARGGMKMDNILEPYDLDNSELVTVENT